MPEITAQEYNTQEYCAVWQADGSGTESEERDLVEAGDPKEVIIYSSVKVYLRLVNANSPLQRKVCGAMPFCLWPKNTDKLL